MEGLSAWRLRKRSAVFIISYLVTETALFILLNGAHYHSGKSRFILQLQGGAVYASH